jgi:phenylalanyl-tRNA synthetase beta chain
VEDATVNRIFERLELKPAQTAQGWTIEVPTFRVDLSGEEDLLEEIARHHGFDKFPATLPPSRGFGALLPQESRIRKLRHALSAAGYSEIYTYSFSNEDRERRFYPDIDPVRLRNPMSEEAAVLRTSLIPGMLTTLQWNMNRGTRNLQLYEFSKVYWNGGERRSLLLAACGNAKPGSVHETFREFDFFTIKGDVEELLQEFDTPMRLTIDNIPKYYHPGRFARVGHLAMFGELHPAYAEPFKFRQRVYLAEIDIELLLGTSASRQIEAIPRYPAIKRDFSLLFDKGTPYAAVHRAVTDAGIAELVGVEPFDRLESGPFPEAKYSLALSVVYQSSERTLTDAEVETFDRKIIQNLEERLGAQLRT